MVDLPSSVTTCSKPVETLSLSGNRGTFEVDLTLFTELKVTVEICDPSGWVLNIGNSPSNNGAGGDAFDFSNDSELDITSTRLKVYANEYAGAAVLLDDPSFVVSVGCVVRIMLIADSSLKTLDPKHEISSPYLFRISQPDKEGKPDALLYVGLNRTIADPTRNGKGIKTAVFELR